MSHNIRQWLSTDSVDGIRERKQSISLLFIVQTHKHKYVFCRCDSTREEADIDISSSVCAETIECNCIGLKLSWWILIANQMVYVTCFYSLRRCCYSWWWCGGCCCHLPHADLWPNETNKSKETYWTHFTAFGTQSETQHIQFAKIGSRNCPHRHASPIQRDWSTRLRYLLPTHCQRIRRVRVKVIQWNTQLHL